MKKSFMSNIKNFVDSNVRQRIERAPNGSDFPGDDLLPVERHFEELRAVCLEAEKKISVLLLSLSNGGGGSGTQLAAYASSLTHLSGGAAGDSATPEPAAPEPQPASQTPQPAGQELEGDMKRHKKLPAVAFLRFLSKSCHKLKPDSLLATAFAHSLQLQTQLARLYLSYEQTLEANCLRPIQQLLEQEVPNVLRLRKLFAKAHHELESARSKHHSASQKQQQQQLQHQQHQQHHNQHQAHFTGTSYTISQPAPVQPAPPPAALCNKLELARKELDEAESRFEQAKDMYAGELYAFVCRESELVAVFMSLYQHQADYHHQLAALIQATLPAVTATLANTPRKPLFGRPLAEHCARSGRPLAPVVELAVHLLHAAGLNEEGLFRIPGSSLKIRRLRSATDAWFVALASHSELLASHQARPDASLLALCDLFKDVVGDHQHQANNGACDAHTLAGLLKLYLRELPEHLFTHALYEQWLEAGATMAAAAAAAAQPDLGRLAALVQELPAANRLNLAHVLRFLHLLASHSQRNKMTPANLAIAVAPSLIWARPAPPTPPAAADAHQDADSADLLSLHMCSLGLSAARHAQLIETLIQQAPALFPGPAQFQVAGLEQRLGPGRPASAQSAVAPALSLERPARTGRRSAGAPPAPKSSSPTALSTASSSSFSSRCSTSSQASSSTPAAAAAAAAANTAPTAANPQAALGPPPSPAPSSSAASRCQSPRVPPPPVPPAPAARSHNTQRPPAGPKPPPPPPPPSSLRRQNPLNKARQTTPL